MIKTEKTTKKPVKKAQTTAKTKRAPVSRASKTGTAKGDKAGTKRGQSGDSLEAKVEKLKAEIEQKGLLDNLLFSELLDTFYYQTKLLDRLRAEIDEGSLVTEKTYIKGKPNASPNKLIATYNATSNARVNTVSAIAKLVKSFNEDEDSSADPLAKILQGG